MKPLLHLMFFTVLFGCCNRTQHNNDLKNEIQQIERDFQKMTVEKGIAEAFYFYAAPNAVIKRERDTLISGKENILAYYKNKHLEHAIVTWSPDFIDISASGDMAYTYGKYTWKIMDETGDTTEYKGIFNTVWKKQADGRWKYVWD